MYMIRCLALCATIAVLSACSCTARTGNAGQLAVALEKSEPSILTGADQVDEIVKIVRGKRVAVLGNQTSVLRNGTHLVDTLLAVNIHIAKIFTPEHGFRGTADAGAKVKDGKDVKTGLPIISLYGNNKKPAAEQLQDVDVVIYDLQDVGVRFYTYISSLEYLIEACAQHQKELVILDRPNPLGNKIDGPVLDKQQRSFVGMQPVPVVYGMTPAEYARMIIGEKWVKADGLKLHIVQNRHYTHDSYYELPVAPSPNLKNMTAVLLYPSLCFFEGTQISLGRGTATPFQVYGHPLLKSISTYEFTPQPVEGAMNPPLKGKTCYGELVAGTAEQASDLTESGLNLSWLLKAYKAYPAKNEFFLSGNFFNLLAGNTTLKQQIISGKTEAEIRRSWQSDLEAFRVIRQKYLLYP